MKLRFADFAAAVARANNLPLTSLAVSSITRATIMGGSLDMDTVPDCQTVDIVRDNSGAHFWLAIR